jgi:hypothetical protein
MQNLKGLPAPCDQARNAVGMRVCGLRGCSGGHVLPLSRACLVEEGGEDGVDLVGGQQGGAVAKAG